MSRAGASWLGECKREQPYKNDKIQIERKTNYANLDLILADKIEQHYWTAGTS